MSRITPLFLSLFIGGCVNYIGQWHYFTDMYYSPAVDAQQIDEIGGRMGDMLPPEGSVAYKQIPYPFTSATAASEAARALNVPSELDTKRGARLYQIYCSPCHGAQGRADGFVKPFMPSILPLAGKEANANKLSVGEIYHIATVGRGTMLGYGSQIRERDRWAIAQFIKQELQEQTSP
ncbi:MAG: cytochrome c [Leptospiraceae bacterium]|nr:cytochrome c [Leptospiraceae bacterium]MDW8306737.1 cytochrome c [Leptospiraceae bacterium]